MVMEGNGNLSQNVGEEVLKTNSEGKKYEYEKNGIYYGGDYLSETPQEVDLNSPENIDGSKEGIKEEKDGIKETSVDKLKKDKEEIDNKIDELDKVLNSIDGDISNLQKQIPGIDGRYVDNEYKKFIKGLGVNFDSKLDILNQIQRDLSNDFVFGNLNEVQKEKVSKSIKMMQELVENLKNKKTGDETYDNQQFENLSRTPLTTIDSKYVEKYNRDINNYLGELIKLNEFKAKIDNDPKNISINDQIFELGQSYQEKMKEKQELQVQANFLTEKINNLENNQ